MQLTLSTIIHAARQRAGAWIGQALMLSAFCFAPGIAEAQALNAQFSSQAVPTSMTASRQYSVTVSMTNTGSEMWLPALTYKLGSLNPADNSAWGLNRVIVPTVVLTGQKATFVFTVTAPSAPGTYNFQWGMTKGATRFGSASTNVSVTVSAAPAVNAAPLVRMLTPATGTTVNSPGSIALSADASDSDGSISKVRFYANGALINTDLVAPYAYVYAGLGAGTYSLTAQATDNLGSSTMSAPVVITVTGVPAISLTRRYVYDENERLCKTVDPEAGATIVDYDAAGNVAWSVQGSTLVSISCDRAAVPEAAKTRRAYDAMNRLITVSTPGGNADVTTSYFADGAVESLLAANPGGYNVRTSYTYNKRRLLTGESASNGSTLFSLGYAYNANGHLSALTYPDGQTVAIRTDALGRTTSLASADVTGPVYASSVRFYANGAISGFSFGNAAIHTMSQNARRLPARSRDVSGSAVVLDDSYAFDANGNVTDITDQAQAGLTTRGMGYDGLDRLTAAVSPGQWGAASYGYDVLDNLRSADQGASKYRYSYNTATNRLANVTSPEGALQFDFDYDAGGNVVRKGSQAFQFDNSNRLSQVTGKETYRYDGMGRRVQTTDADGKTTFWMYSQSGQVLYTSEARRSRNISYIYLGNSLVATRTIAWSTGLLTMRWQHTDALGSAVATTIADGSIPRRVSFMPYGANYGAIVIDGVGYTGHVMDAGTGLTYMQQRYYDPQIGRFLSVDPMVSDMNNGWNFSRYEYAANNPYSFKDPDGRIIETLWDVANVVMDVASLGGNLATGNYGGAAVDAGGLLLDLAATALPGVPGGAGTAIKIGRGAERAREVLKVNKVAGKAGEARTAAKLGDSVAGAQVSFRNSDGTLTRADFVTKDGLIIETKTGNAQLSAGQKSLMADIKAGRPVTPVGKNAERAGLKPGVPIKMNDMKVDQQ